MRHSGEDQYQMFEMRLFLILVLLPVINAQTPTSSGFHAIPGGTLQAQPQQQYAPVVYNQQQPTPYDPTHGGQQLYTGSPGPIPQPYQSSSGQIRAWPQYPPPQPYPLSFLNMWRYLSNPSMLRRNPLMYATLFDGFFDLGF